MSSLRNAIPQKTYKERSQPGGRARHGLLEKKKDYKLRARDHKIKQAKLKALQQKARDRNPDEFYFGMANSTTRRDGRKVAEDGGRGNKALSNDVVKLLKTQDTGYVRTMLQRTARERQRLEAEISIVETEGERRLQALKDAESKSGKHTVFVDDVRDQKGFDANEWFDTDPAGLHQAFNRPRKGAAQDADAAPEPRNDREKEAQKQQWKQQRRQQDRTQSMKEARVQRLEDVRAREKELRVAERELDVQRAKMNGNTSGTNKNGVKFRVRQRKR